MLTTLGSAPAPQDVLCYSYTMYKVNKTNHAYINYKILTKITNVNYKNFVL